jgi:hypothetical protein
MMRQSAYISLQNKESTIKPAGNVYNCTHQKLIAS